MKCREENVFRYTWNARIVVMGLGILLLLLQEAQQLIGRQQGCAVMMPLMFNELMTKWLGSIE